MPSCSKCHKRNTCTELCEEAEKYVNQDYVELKEILIDKPISYIESPPQNITKSNQEIIIRAYFVSRKTQIQIAKILDVSQSYVSKVVKRHRKIIIKNLKK